MGARWRSVTVGVSCQIIELDLWGETRLNPSHSFLKTANVSFEEIIPFCRQVGLCNYGPLQGMYGITRACYQGGKTERN